MSALTDKNSKIQTSNSLFTFEKVLAPKEEELLKLPFIQCPHIVCMTKENTGVTISPFQF